MFLKEILWFKAVYLIKFLFNSETQSVIVKVLNSFWLLKAKLRGKNKIETNKGRIEK